jgi:hypothetical protein
MIRRGGPGLLGMAARTAVVAGTATAVSGRVAANQQQRAMQEQAAAQAHDDQVRAQAMAEMQAQQMMQAAPPPPPPVAAPAAPSGDDTMAQLQQLAAMKAQGLLTDAEFAAAKAKLLGL